MVEQDTIRKEQNVHRGVFIDRSTGVCVIY